MNVHLVILAGDSTGTAWGGPIALAAAAAGWWGCLLAVELREMWLAKREGGGEEGEPDIDLPLDAPEFEQDPEQESRWRKVRKS